MKKKIVYFLLIFSFCFSLCGCADGANDATVNVYESAPYDGGIHEIHTAPTDSYLFEDGKSEYSVLIPENASSTVRTAATELTSFLYESIGIVLPVISEDALPSNAKILSVGNTRAAQSAGILFNYEQLGSQGYLIRTVGENVFMGGAGDFGTLYSVYGFLSLTVGYDYYYTDCYYVEKYPESLALLDYDVTDVPDIEYRDATYGYVTEDSAVANRYRMIRRESFCLPIGGKIGHNALSWLKSDINTFLHPDWFDSANNPSQPCYTAHGNDDEYALMLQCAVQSLQESLMANRDMSVVLFACEDNYEVCTCSSCLEAREYYGSDAGAMVVFVNAIKNEIDKWFEGEGKEYARDLTIAFYAYLGYEEAPSRNVVCSDGVVPYIALIHADYMVGLNRPENAEYYRVIEDWHALSDDIHFYFYDTNYSYYFTPYNTFDSMQDNYRLAASFGSSLIHNLGQPNQTSFSTGFSVLKVYLESKLGWNVNADVSALTDLFFERYFESAAEPMRKYFDEYRLHAVLQHDELGYSGFNTIYREAVTAEFWPRNLLERWIGYTNEAMEAIAPLQETDQSLYDKLYKRISGERVNLYYLYIELYDNYVDSAELGQMKQTTKNDVDALGMRYFKENTVNGPLSILWSSWGV